MLNANKVGERYYLKLSLYFTGKKDKGRREKILWAGGYSVSVVFNVGWMMLIHGLI